MSLPQKQHGRCDHRSHDSKPVDDFYGLFMVPGLQHCADRAGPVNFGNIRLNGVTRRADRDLFTALEQWVEKGVTPDQTIGSGLAPLDPAAEFLKEALQLRRTLSKKAR
jgi:hypothetical protein